MQSQAVIRVGQLASVGDQIISILITKYDHTESYLLLSSWHLAV